MEAWVAIIKEGAWRLVLDFFSLAHLPQCEIGPRGGNLGSNDHVRSSDNILTIAP